MKMEIDTNYDVIIKCSDDKAVISKSFNYEQFIATAGAVAMYLGKKKGKDSTDIANHLLRAVLSAAVLKPQVEEEEDEH